MTLEQIETPLFTLEQFEAFINMPENTDKVFEFIAGEIVEVPSNPYVSAISAQIIFLIKLFLHQHKIKGHVTGEAGGYMVAGERYTPDVAYISYEKQPQLAKSGYNPNPSDLAVEVISWVVRTRWINSLPKHQLPLCWDGCLGCSPNRKTRLCASPR